MNATNVFFFGFFVLNHPLLRLRQSIASFQWKQWSLSIEPLSRSYPLIFGGSIHFFRGGKNLCRVCISAFCDFARIPPDRPFCTPPVGSLEQLQPTIPLRIACWFLDASCSICGATALQHCRPQRRRTAMQVPDRSFAVHCGTSSGLQVFSFLKRRENANLRLHVWWHLKIVKFLIFSETFLSPLGWVWVIIW